MYTVRIGYVYYLNLNQTGLIISKKIVPNQNQLYGKTKSIQTKKRIGSNWFVVMKFNQNKKIKLRKTNRRNAYYQRRIIKITEFHIIITKLT